jgi:hypothetical protein
MGPVYLHWDGHYQTYRFFSHIQSHLHDIKGTEISGKQLVFGSDEEKAMTKALHHCFPDSKHILCTHHLEENVRRKLKSMICLVVAIPVQINWTHHHMQHVMSSISSCCCEIR